MAQLWDSYRTRAAETNPGPKGPAGVRSIELKQLMSMPLDPYTQKSYPDLRAACAAAGCDGLEMMWSGLDMPKDVPKELRVGYHLAYYPTWMDFWEGNRSGLLREFDSEALWTGYYGGSRPERLMEYYREDLDRAEALDAQYVVFHVAEITLEEHYTYQWRHSHAEVIDAAAEVLNQVFQGRDTQLLLLVENQWLPGFTFTDPAMTSRLLDQIDYPNKGIMLDIGHLMNCNPALKTEEEGADYVQRMLDAHGALCHQIRGLHLHQSLSGAYVRSHVGPGQMPANQPKNYYDRLTLAYEHLYRIDQHQPWHSEAIRPIIQRIAPDFIVHELSNHGPEDYLQRIHTQQRAAGL